MEIATFIFSAVSLALAFISFCISIKAQHLQNRVNEMDVRLKQYELTEKEKGQKSISCVEARIIREIKNKYKIKVWNSGNTTAKNVVVSWDRTEGIIFFDNDKMPFEVLEPQKNFELEISTYDGRPSKLCIKTEWEDENGEKKTKTQWCSM